MFPGYEYEQTLKVASVLNHLLAMLYYVKLFGDL